MIQITDCRPYPAVRGDDVWRIDSKLPLSTRCSCTGLAYWLAATVWYHKARDRGRRPATLELWSGLRLLVAGSFLSPQLWAGRFMHMQRSDRLRILKYRCCFKLLGEFCVMFLQNGDDLSR